VKNMELIKTRDKMIWWSCGNCGYKSATKGYKIGKLELWLCSDCVGKINKILAEAKEEECHRRDESV